MSIESLDVIEALEKEINRLKRENAQFVDAQIRLTQLYLKNNSESELQQLIIGYVDDLETIYLKSEVTMVEIKRIKGENFRLERLCQDKDVCWNKMKTYVSRQCSEQIFNEIERLENES